MPRAGTWLFSRAHVAWLLTLFFVRQRHRPIRDRELRCLEQHAEGIYADESIDVKRTEEEDKGIDRTKDHERDCRRAGRQERCHGVSGSQHSKDNPVLTADFSW